MNWIRIPADIQNQADRDTLVMILARNGLEVKQTKVKEGTRYRRYVEYREQEREQKNEG